jgi:hypothetical protein
VTSITSSTLVLLDANVLYPFTLRDTLLRVAEQRFYQPRWTATILDEVTRNLIKNQQVTPAQAERLAAVMTRAFPSAQVEGYQHRVSMMTNQAKDRHVAAAAVHAGLRHHRDPKPTRLLAVAAGRMRDER